MEDNVKYIETFAELKRAIEKAKGENKYVICTLLTEEGGIRAVCSLSDKSLFLELTSLKNTGTAIVKVVRHQVISLKEIDASPLVTLMNKRKLILIEG